MKLYIRLLMSLLSFGSLFACAQGKSAYPTVNAQEFAQQIKADSKAYVLDVRTPQEYAEGHIDNAHNLDWLNQAAFKKGAADLPKDETIYVYCRSGRRSADAANFLTKLGYKVVDLDGGWIAWQRNR